MGSEVLSYFSYVTLTRVYISQAPIVATFGNHPLIDDVAAIVPWLISSSSLHPTPFLPKLGFDHTLHDYSLLAKQAGMSSC